MDDVRYRYDVVQKREWLGDESTRLVGVSISLSTFRVIKHTPKGVWLDIDKWVSNTGRKRFAYQTKEDALESCRIRNARRINYLTNDLEVAKLAKEAFKNPDLYKEKEVFPYASLRS